MKPARTALRAVAALLLLAWGLGAHAAPPPAGTQIGNQASATYTDASNTPRSVTSNVVVAVVQQAAGVLHTQDASRTVAIGGQVAYPLTVTNTGNGSDSFALTWTQSGAFAFSSVQFYADANGDGVADNTTPITSSGALPQDGVFRYVAVGTVPGSASAGNTNALVITATSAFNGATQAAVTETTTVTANAVLTLSKAMSAAAGAPGSGPYTVTLTYNNSGNTAATAVQLRDVLPAGLVYVAGSARWSATGTTVLTDADASDVQGTGPTIVYDFNVGAANRVSAQISSVAPGQSGTLSFQVTVAPYDTANASGQAAGTVNNTASVAYNDGAGTVGPVPSNTVGFNVGAVAAVTMSGQTVASASQGATVTFTNTLRNTGNATDSFDITLAANSFPAGSTVALYRADGATPLLDSNGNGIPDTGPLASGATTSVVLRVTLPTAASGGPYQVSKVATSKLDASKSASANDVLTTIASSTVDLTNTAALGGAGVSGSGAGAEASPQRTQATGPGTTTRFTLYVNNTSAAADSFDLAASTNASFGSLTLPAGWSVVFRDASGAVVSNSGVVNAGAATLIYADVTVPAGYAATPAPGQSLYFRVLSPTTGAGDRIHDAVIVNTVRALSLTPNHSGQVFPGSSVVYAHVLANGGNVTENGANTMTLALANSAAGFSAVVYRDANDNGVIDAGDPVVNGAADLGAIAPGASVRLLLRVAAAPGAAIGATDTATLSVSTSGAINGTAPPPAAGASDITTVIAGNVTLRKDQALDANCDGIADGAYTNANLVAGAAPGACIRYRIVLTNIGTADVLSVVFSDAMPAHTTYHATVPAASTQGTVSAPAAGAGGTLGVNVGTVAPAASVTVTFGVRINR
jgi:trimeric autotransporter adhesin